MTRIAQLSNRREALLAQSTLLRGQCETHLRALSGPVRALDGATSLLARLRRVPLRLLVGLAREGLGAALSTKQRRATVLAGVATTAAALVKRWRRRKPEHAKHAGESPHV